MIRKNFSIKTLQQLTLYVIASVLTFTTLTQPVTALSEKDFDRGFASRNNIEFYHPCGTDPNVDSSSTTTPGEYIKLGNIPTDGLVLGASVFGGKQQGSKWVANWADNNGNDKGNHDNHLTGTTSFAELTLHGKLGDALGDIPDGSKLEIIYGGKKIIAEKGDVGTGGPSVSGIAPADGKNITTGKDVKEGQRTTAGRAVDLWWETANLLGVSDGTVVVTVHALDKNTKPTPLASKPQADTPTTGVDTGTGACCPATDTATGDGNLVGKTNEEKIWNFLVGNDGQLSAQDALSANQAAGLMGNIQQESGFRPEALNSIGAFGIVQWLGGRRANLEKAAKKKGVSSKDLNLQLHFLVEESKSRHVIGAAASKYGNKGKSEWATLRKQDSIEKAADFWNLSFEVSGTSSQVRANNGKKIYDKMIKKYPVKGGGGTPATTAAGGGTSPVVFLDPGHGGNIPDYTDPKSHLVTNETNNGKEDRDVLEVANKVKTQLEGAGYKVVMARTKNNMSASETPKFRERADAAAKAHAGIGVSIHTSPGGPNDAWSQKVGTFRESKNGSNRDTFKNGDTASNSQRYAKAIADARSKEEKHKVGLDSDHKHQESSFGRGGNIKSPGNIPLVALWSPTVPWVYNEIEQNKGEGLKDSTKEAYAKGIVDGIKEALPATAGGCESNTADASGLTGYVLKYAWPTHHDVGWVKPMPAYKKEVIDGHPAGRYIGGIQYPGIDCGGFTTNLIINSGYDPKYNSSGKGGATGAQQDWLNKHWEKIGTGSTVKVGTNLGDKKVLRPGDVAIWNAPAKGHTFIYVGKIDKFQTKIASASLDGRSPMAGIENPNDAKFTWYRKK